MKKFTAYLSMLFLLMILAGIGLFYQNMNSGVKEITVSGRDSSAIQQALNQARTEDGIEVSLPKGRYAIKDTLVVYSHTKITMEEGAVLVRRHDGPFLANGKTGGEYTGYSGNGDITIEGGTLEGSPHKEKYGEYGYGGMEFAHADHLVIRNVIIKDIVYSHAIEINSSRNVTIDHCSFLGYLDPTADGSRSNSEAVQIDVSAKSGFPHFGEWDGTPSKDITLKNNDFGGSSTSGMKPWPVGVGGHSGLKEVWNQGITLVNNTFKGMSYAGIRCYFWKNALIKENRFMGIETPVLVENPENSYMNKQDIQVEGNTYH